jgi:nucleotide-binding universal stress UspA family protein
MATPKKLLVVCGSSKSKNVLGRVPRNRISLAPMPVLVVKQ